MRTLGGLQPQLNKEVMHLAMCVVLELRDETVLRFTDHDTNITRLGYVYESIIGFNPFASRSTSDATVDNIQVDGVLDSASITEQDLIAGKYDFAKVECFVVDYTMPDAGKITTVMGHLGEVSTDGREFRAQLRGLGQRLEQQILRIYSPSCDATFGDERCGFTRAHVVGTVTEILEDKLRFKVSHSGSLPVIYQNITIPYNDDSGVNGTSALGWYTNLGYIYYRSSPYNGVSGAEGTMLHLRNTNSQNIEAVQLIDLVEGACTAAAIDAGITFTFSVYQGNSAGDEGGFSVKFYDADKAEILASSVASTFVDAGLVVAKRSITGSVPVGARYAQLKLIQKYTAPDATGDAMFDRLEFATNISAIAFTAVNGYVEWDVGSLNHGLTMDIRAISDESPTLMEIELYEPIGYSIGVGDSVFVHAGCDKTLSMCKSTYYNVPNFRGFPHIPGYASMLNNYG